MARLTTAHRRESAGQLRRVVDLVEAKDLDAPRWYVERLRGAIAALDHRRGNRPI
jgi:hypothetical protein